MTICNLLLIPINYQLIALEFILGRGRIEYIFSDSYLNFERSLNIKETIYILFLIILCGSSFAGEDELRYKIQAGDNISDLLNDLGVCPIWGPQSRVKKILQLNPKIDSRNLEQGQIVLIPYSYLTHPNEVLFMDKGLILPKNKGSKVCTKDALALAKKKTKVIKKPKLEILEVAIHANEKLLKEKSVEFLLKFNRPIAMRGTPSLDIQAKGSLGVAQFLKLQDKSTMVFSYSYDYELEKIGSFKITIPKGKDKFSVFDTDGKYFNPEKREYEVSSSLVDQSPPQIIKYYPHRKGIYKFGDKLILDIVYDEKIFIKGTPQLNLHLDNKKVKAKYINIIGGKLLRFHYYIQKDDQALNGVEVDEFVEVPGGHIRDWLGNKISSSSKRVFLRDVKIKQNIVTVESIKLPVTRTYRFGEVLKFTLKYSEPVVVRGNPILNIEVGEEKREANYLRSSSQWVSFTYKISNYDFDSDGITIMPQINTSEGEIYSSNKLAVDLNVNAPPTTAIKVNSGRSRVVHVHGPTQSGFKKEDKLEIALEFNEVIKINEEPSIRINIAGNNRVAKFSHQERKKIFFKYIVQEDDHGKGLDIKSPIIIQPKGILGKNGNPIETKFNSLSLPKIYVDTKSPKVLRVQYPTDETFGYRDRIEFVFLYDEPVFVNGNPRLRIDLRSGDVLANYKSGSGSKRIIYEYSVHSIDRELKEIILAPPIDTVHGNIRDNVGNEAIHEFRAIDINTIKIDGGINYGLIRENQDGFQQDKDATVNNYESNYALDLLFSSTKMSSTDKEDGSVSRLRSSLDIGAYFHFFFKWLPELISDAKVGLKRIEFDEASNFTIHNLENEYFEFDFTTKYHFTKKFDLLFSMGIKQTPFIHAQGTSLLVIDPVSVNNFALGVDWNFSHFRNLSFGLSTIGKYYLSRSSDNFNLNSGTGARLSFYIDNFGQSSKLRFELFGEYQKQNSTIFEQNTSVSGFLFHYHFSSL